ncbi:helix-turn-helix domain-containing protein [Chloroflexota bacterium]
MGQNKSSRDVERIFFTFAEVQEFLGVSHQTIYKLMGGGLPSHLIGKKRVFIKEDMVRWIKEH